MTSANNFLVVYLGLELMSLSLYALVALRRDHAVATEAAMKYFVLGALASGFLLYGLSMMYGATGTLEIPRCSKRSPPAASTGGAGLRRRVRRRRPGLQARRRALPHVGARRLPGRAHRRSRC
jgi:NADH:ubiquinone oxidoreductase subunit 5 (subunit L)/multisubunit Na+/H+ antiporter MnhA subunit